MTVAEVPATSSNNVRRNVRIAAGALLLEGELNIPKDPAGIVLFAHGSGSSRHSPRNQFVARTIRDAQIGTLLFDLLSPGEEALDRHTGQLRFDVDLLVQRLIDATNWLKKEQAANTLSVGYFGASTGAAAALIAAVALGDVVEAVVSRGGRADLAGNVLPRVKAPTLLLVGGRDEEVMELNLQAFGQLNCKKALDVIPGATHLFEEAGALDNVAHLAANWFRRHLGPGNQNSPQNQNSKGGHVSMTALRPQT